MGNSKHSFWTEADRLAELDRHRIIDTPSEVEFDAIVQQAAAASGAPVALITFLTEDRQWFKAAIGTALTGTMRAISFCTHAIEQDDTMIVHDATNDTRFADNPIVTNNPNIRFYAGVPLRAASGMPLGTLCVLDNKIRDFSDDQRRILEDLARQVVEILEIRKNRLAAAAN